VALRLAMGGKMVAIPMDDLQLLSLVRIPILLVVVGSRVLAA